MSPARGPDVEPQLVGDRGLQALGLRPAGEGRLGFGAGATGDVEKSLALGAATLGHVARVARPVRSIRGSVRDDGNDVAKGPRAGTGTVWHAACTRLSSMPTPHERTTVLQPGIVLPAQLFRRATNFSPEQRLMLAVLEEGVSCLQRFVHPRGRPQRHLLERTRKWFLSNDDLWPFSCTNICSALGIDVSYLRRGLAPWLDHDGTAPPVVAVYKARRSSGTRTRLTPIRIREPARAYAV